MHGAAKVTYCSGLTYEGHVERGKIDGQGTSVLPTGSIFFSGHWEHGIPKIGGCGGCFYTCKFLGGLLCYLCHYNCCGCFTPYDPQKVQEHITWVSLGMGVANAFCCGKCSSKSTTIQKEGSEAEGYIVHSLPAVNDSMSTTDCARERGAPLGTNSTATPPAACNEALQIDR